MIRATKFKELGYGLVEAGCWRFIDLTSGLSGRAVGPAYPTQQALLADLPRYAWESWGLGGGPKSAPLNRKEFYRQLCCLLEAASASDTQTEGGNDLPPQFARQGRGESLGVYGHLRACLEALKSGAVEAWSVNGDWPPFDPAPCPHKFRPGDRVMSAFPSPLGLYLVGTIAGVDPTRPYVLVGTFDPYYLLVWDVEGPAEGWRESDLTATDK